MPIISRPQTDLQRLEALEAAKNKADVTAPADLAFSPDTLARLVIFLPQFRLEVQQMGSALSAQAAATLTASAEKRHLYLNVSHFIQVFNLGVDRDIYTKEQRAFFMLDVNSDKLPRLVTEQELATWGQRIVSGDAARVAAGGAAMANPSAANVAAAHTAYLAAQGNQSTKKDAYDHEQEDVAALRDDADDLIADIWDEVEFTFRKETNSSKRRKAREYGVVYIPSRGETPSPDDFSLMGTITDAATGNPINEVVVAIENTPVVALTDAEGKYFIGVQPAGTYSLIIYKGGYQLKNVPNVTVTAGAITTYNATLDTEGPTGSVTASVKMAGVPVINAKVSVEGIPGNYNTDAAGKVVINTVPEGDQTIRAELNNGSGLFQTLPVTVLADGNVDVQFNF